MAPTGCVPELCVDKPAQSTRVLVLKLWPALVRAAKACWTVDLTMSKPTMYGAGGRSGGDSNFHAQGMSFSRLSDAPIEVNQVIFLQHHRDAADLDTNYSTFKSTRGYGAAELLCRRRAFGLLLRGRAADLCQRSGGPGWPRPRRRAASLTSRAWSSCPTRP